MEEDFLSKLTRRMVNAFMDIIILSKLEITERESEVTGYNLMKLINKKFNILVGTGTVYAVLYSMERKGLICSSLKGRRRIYKLTDQGEQVIQSLSASNLTSSNLIEALSLN